MYAKNETVSCPTTLSLPPTCLPRLVLLILCVGSVNFAHTSAGNAMTRLPGCKMKCAGVLREPFPQRNRQARRARHHPSPHNLFLSLSPASLSAFPLSLACYLSDHSSKYTTTNTHTCTLGQIHTYTYSTLYTAQSICSKCQFGCGRIYQSVPLMSKIWCQKEAIWFFQARKTECTQECPAPGGVCKGFTRLPYPARGYWGNSSNPIKFYEVIPQSTALDLSVCGRDSERLRRRESEEKGEREWVRKIERERGRIPERERENGVERERRRDGRRGRETDVHTRKHTHTHTGKETERARTPVSGDSHRQKRRRKRKCERRWEGTERRPWRT